MAGMGKVAEQKTCWWLKGAKCSLLIIAVSGKDLFLLFMARGGIR